MCRLELVGLNGSSVQILKDPDRRDHTWPHFFCIDPRQIDSNITRWNNIHELLDDERVMLFLQGVSYLLDQTTERVQTVTMEFPEIVGYVGVAEISSLPQGTKVVEVERRGVRVKLVVGVLPSKTNLLTFYFSFKGGVWYIGTVYAGPASPSFSDSDWWSQHAFFDMREVKEECY